MNMLSVEHVSKFYGQRQAALADVSFNVQKGELVFLTGPSGAGKTTLLRMLYYEDRPSIGNIILGPFDFSRLKKKQIPILRRHVGIAFQNSRLIPERTARENVALALEVAGRRGREIVRKAEEALKQAGIWQKRNNYPDQLSGGEAQRVALARAMVGEPLMLLADEPTGNLDEENAREIFSLIRQYNELGATIIVATHQIGLVKEFGGRTIHLVSGFIESDIK